jgi:hypothetical protein
MLDHQLLAGQAEQSHGSLRVMAGQYDQDLVAAQTIRLTPVADRGRHGLEVCPERLVARCMALCVVHLL